MFKNTSVKLSEGTDQSLQGLNTEIADQTLQVVGAGLQAASSIAGSVLTAEVPVGPIAKGIGQNAKPALYENLQRRHLPGEKAAAPQKTTNACSRDANSALSKYNADTKALQDRIKNAKSANPASDAAVSYETTQVANEQSAITATIVRTIVPKVNERLVDPGADKDV
ncbi:MAG TPA: hypothetical protein VED85_03495, partial [Burkholderiaceae bacterium]|nr:hypothetical protein [Burkholderiaceae bacterium]